jgi:uncharacterized protein (TIGR02646 family)
MRPVIRGQRPQRGGFDRYRKAFPELLSRLGPYCSYCERRIPTNLAIEHLEPKTLCSKLEGDWDNFLLACVNCNACKGSVAIDFSTLYFPDRDNTFIPFHYVEDGRVDVHSRLGKRETEIAKNTLALTGLDKRPKNQTDENGKLVATDRIAQRAEAWSEAEDAKKDLAECPTDAMRRRIAKEAKAAGFFSIWMHVFSDDPDMRERFIQAYSGSHKNPLYGTAADCFVNTKPVLRPAKHVSHLKHHSKI